MANGLEALPMPILQPRGLAALRDRLLTDPRFLAWASAFPLTRMIARRRAKDLFSLCAGFVYSQVLFACVKLGLFDLLRAQPLAADAIAAKLDLSGEAVSRLLTAAESLRLVEKRRGGRFGLGALGAAVAANPGIGAMVEHHAHLYADLADPVGLLRGEKSQTALSGYWPYADSASPGQLSDQQVGPYSELMAKSLPLVAEEVLDAYPPGRHNRLLDIGGGEGGFIAAAAARAPELDLTLFDLPAVAERAKARLSASGLGRVTVVGGDFKTDALPKGADLISLIRVVLDHDDSTALGLLRAARQALTGGGTLLLAEPLAELGAKQPMVDSYFGLYLLAMGRGKPRTYQQLKQLLTKAGFGRISLRWGQGVLRTGIVTGRPQA